MKISVQDLALCAFIRTVYRLGDNPLAGVASFLWVRLPKCRGELETAARTDVETLRICVDLITLERPGLFHGNA